MIPYLITTILLFVLDYALNLNLSIWVILTPVLVYIGLFIILFFSIAISEWYKLKRDHNRYTKMKVSKK